MRPRDVWARKATGRSRETLFFVRRKRRKVRLKLGPDSILKRMYGANDSRSSKFKEPRAAVAPIPVMAHSKCVGKGSVHYRANGYS